MVPGPGDSTGGGQMLDSVGSKACLTSGEEGRKRNGLEQPKLGSLGIGGAEVGLVVGNWIFAILIWHPARGAEWQSRTQRSSLEIMGIWLAFKTTGLDEIIKAEGVG